MGLAAGEGHGHGRGLEVGLGTLEQVPLWGMMRKRGVFGYLMLPYSQTRIVVINAAVSLSGVVILESLVHLRPT